MASSRGRDTRWPVVGFACALIAALFLVPAFMAQAASSPGGPGNGAIPDLTMTPLVLPPGPPIPQPPFGQPLWTPTPKATEVGPCVGCEPLETPNPTSTEAARSTATRFVPPPRPTSQPTVPRGSAHLALRPLLQFGHAQPGGAVMYHHLLVERQGPGVDVSLGTASLGQWPLNVTPGEGTVRPDASLPITLTVGVPLSPTFLLDVERLDTSVDGRQAASAYMITLVGRRPFSDLSEGHWADDPVQYLAARGVVSGYEDGTFRPDDKVSRAQFVKMLIGALAWTPVLPETPTFRDVPRTHWAYAYIETAVARGIISGYADGTFHPDDRVSRAQVAKMISTARGWNGAHGAHGSFTDVGPSDWMFSYVEAASMSDVMSGYSDGTFRPYQPATRAQIAKIVTLSIFSEPDN